MIKKFFIVPILLFTLLNPLAAVAKPVIDEFENKSYNLSDIKRALILPIKIEESVSVPPSEAFFAESLAQHWDEIVASGALDALFVIKTPEQIVSADEFVKGAASSQPLSRDAILERAIELSPEYVDAIVSLTVTDAKYGVVSHDARTNWDVGIGVGWGGYYRHGGWGYGVFLPPPSTSPAWDQSFAIGAIKIEVREVKSKEHSLVYGLSVKDSVPGGALPYTPSLTKVVDALLDTAAAHLSKK